MSEKAQVLESVRYQKHTRSSTFALFDMLGGHVQMPEHKVAVPPPPAPSYVLA